MLKNRIVWIDTARGLSIFLVVMGHTILPHSWLIYIYSFHMPFFFLLSGYTYFPEKYANFGNFLKRKSFSLLIPYLFFCLVGLAYFIPFFKPSNLNETFFQMLWSSNQLHAPFIPLWFLTCLFLTEIIFYFFQKYLKPIFLFLAVIVSLAIGLYFGLNYITLFWSLDIALVGILFYYLGYVIKNNQTMIDKMSSLWLYSLTAIFLVLNFVLAYSHNYYVSMIYRAYGNAWYFLSASIFGVLGYLLLSKILKETVLKKITIVEFMGKNSLVILGFHTILFYLVSDIFRVYFNINPTGNLLYAFIYTVLTIILIVPFIYALNRWTPFLIGRVSKKV